MTQAQFVDTLYRTLKRMGDPHDAEELEYNPILIREYNSLKHLTVRQFTDLCNAGNHIYNRSKNKNNN
jgi:hypothetical protein